MKAQLRPSLPEDRDFLFRLYASTRMEEIRGFGWSAAQQEAFLRMQFNAQQQWYQATYSTAESQIIEKDHEPIGRMIVQHEAGTWRLLDISLLPEHRGQGIGGDLIRNLIVESVDTGAGIDSEVCRMAGTWLSSEYDAITTI